MIVIFCEDVCGLLRLVTLPLELHSHLIMTCQTYSTVRDQLEVDFIQ